MSETLTATRLFDYDRWNASLAADKAAYATADPYPHAVLENFLTEEVAQAARASFPEVGSESWINYVHVNEKKHGLNKIDQMPAEIRAVIEELNSESFLVYLRELTGIDKLIPDWDLEGGGLHQSPRGGYLNIHADFTVHPHKRHWRRRVNVLVYLNTDGWKEEWNGHLELWDREMKACAQKVYPIFNRAVIFNTDADSYHGLPDPLKCPEGETRRSIALYYFTEEEKKPKLHSTNYKARPQDKGKFWIWLDKKVLHTYSWVKRTFGLSDDFASRVLGAFSRKKKKRKKAVIEKK